MWDDLVMFGILGLFIALVIAPIIALILRLFKKSSFKKGWMISTIVLNGFLIFVVGTALVVNHFEEESYLKKMDGRLEEMDDKVEGNSTEKVLMEIYTTGNFRGSSFSGRRSGDDSGTVSYLIKNYNEDHFVGKATIYILHNEEVIDKTEVDLDLSAQEELSDFVYASTLNIAGGMWFDIEFEYSIQGDFK